MNLNYLNNLDNFGANILQHPQLPTFNQVNAQQLPHPLPHPLPPLGLPPPPPPAPANPADPAAPAAPNPPNARAQHVINHRLVLNSVRGRRILWLAVGSVVVTVVSILLATVAPWFHVQNAATYYCKDNYLWTFLLPPLTALPLLVSSISFVGRLCWWHCWTVTVISIDVPAAVVFVSFGASLVYTGVGAVEWNAGAYFVLLAYIAGIVAGLFFMKLAHLIEVGIPPPPDGPPVGPITVHIGVDMMKDKSEFSSTFSDGPGSAVA